jgi:hypothetical protein
MFEVLDDNNIELYALKHYDNPQPLAGVDEFYDDFKRIKYIKRLLNRYKAGDALKCRLLLNHIIVLYNVFSPEASTRILFYKLDVEDHSILKTFLMFLGYMPDVIFGIGELGNIQSGDIQVDAQIVDFLRNI